MTRYRAVLLSMLALAAAVATTALAISASGSGARTDAAAATPGTKKPNFVFVLTDDLSRNLLPYMKNVQAMERQGTSFKRYIVTDSLCCPSRSSIFTGRYPHSTGVVTNMAPDGGFDVLHARGEEKDTFATTLQGRGYDTAMMGKYLNGYKPLKAVDGAPRYVPPGWSAWSVAGNGYPQFNYNLLDKEVGGQPRVIHHGNQPSDYLTDVISQRGQQFIGASVKRGNPFMLELATFAPHAPYTPAPRDAGKFPNAKIPRTKIFNQPQQKPRPSWLSTTKLDGPTVAKLDADFRKRAQSVQAVDKMIGDIRAELKRLGVADNTYIVFSSDNGYHMGDRRLTAGKQTAYDHDIRVPLVVLGPQVKKHHTRGELAANVDLRPTFEQLAGAPANSRVEGRSLVSLLRGDRVRSWRDLALIEHHGPNTNPADPDKATKRQGNPPSYLALRTQNWAYIQYDDKHYRPEYYELRIDANERKNVYGTLSAKRKAQLRARVARLHACTDKSSCHAADR